jgi:sugar/nucleoside kinase (ribokinase family)
VTPDVVVGHIGRNLVLLVDELPDPAGQVTAPDRRAMLGRERAAGRVVVWPGGEAVVPLVDGPVLDPTGAGDALGGGPDR